MPEPKDDRKGTEPKDDRKGTEPKDDRKGSPTGVGAGGCGNDGAAMHILQSAAQLCGFLVVAVVAPMSGGGGPQSCSSAGSPRQVAFSELRRKAEFKQRDAQFRAPVATPTPAAPARPSAAPKAAVPAGGPKVSSGTKETENSKSPT